MTEVLTGFAIIAIIIGVGYGVGRAGMLGKESHAALARLIYFVLSPCLLFGIMAQATASQLFSPLVIISVLAAASAMAIYAAIARLRWHRPVNTVVIGALSAGYVNANNMGLPVATYVLGDAAYVAPVLLVQLLIFAPVSLTILDAHASGRFSWRLLAMAPLKNPIIIASFLGMVVGLLDIPTPRVIMEPVLIIGAAAVPMMLLNYGISLPGQKVLQAGSERKEVILSSVIKLVWMPLVAYLITLLIPGISPADIFAVVALAALPTAQNIYNYAQRFRSGEVLARDTIFITTFGSLGIMLLVAALLR